MNWQNVTFSIGLVLQFASALIVKTERIKNLVLHRIYVSSTELSLTLKFVFLMPNKIQ